MSDGPHPPAPSGRLLFVYGTLRRGGAAHHLLTGAEFVGLTSVEGTLFDTGEFPALVLGPDGKVEGEIWRCGHETLHVLDSYEGVDDALFRRVSVHLEHGEVWTYVAGPRLLPRLRFARIIASGRWHG